MSISGTISSSLSGLTAASRAAELVSTNIANAMTPGYGRREIALTSRQIGAVGNGVEVIGVKRVTNLIAINERRHSDATLGQASARAAYYRKLESTIGVPDSTASLTARVATFDASLLSAASRPDSEAKLSEVANAARAIATQIAAASKEIQAGRRRAEEQIVRDVELLNSTLARISDLNTQIRALAIGSDSSTLQDQRQQAIDSITAIVPLREVARDGGTVALVTLTGGVLLDGPVATIEFGASGVITPEMTLESGALSPLILNGNAVSTGAANASLAGGRLAANFAIRDEIGVQAQAKLDAIARDLVERFQDPAVDPTLAPGAAGLFTDAGVAFEPANEVGLSGRLRLNALVDPQQGGELWRLRDGIGAAAPGLSSDATLLGAMQSALNALREPASGDFMPGTRTFSELIGEHISTLTAQRLGAESDESFAIGTSDALITTELGEGVDTDTELQKLLLIEQVYTANAKVMQTIDDLLKTLLGM